MKNSRIYSIGEIGPAGGFIFYDKGEYSEGWRYLEAAPNDLRVFRGRPTVNGDSSKYWSAQYGDFQFGYYRKFYNSPCLIANRVNDDCSKIGLGKINTKEIVAAMGRFVYGSGTEKEKSKLYAARLCYKLKYKGYHDWFLPSKEELDLMYKNLKRAGIGWFSDGDYWSSSEYNDDASVAWAQHFSNGDQYCDNRYFLNYVRPCRAF